LKNKNQPEICKENNKTKKNIKKSNLFFHKRKSKIEIDANKHGMKNIKSNDENNKDNNHILNENIKLNYNSLDNKKDNIRNNHFVKNNYLFQKFKKVNNIPNESKPNYESKEEEKVIMNEQIILVKNNSEEEEEKNFTKKKSPQSHEKKNEKNKNSKSNSKNDTPLLQLNDIKSSSSSSISNIKHRKSVTSEDLTSSSYDSNNHFEIKGELLSTKEKTNFLNNIKKCLFNKDINIPEEKTLLKNIVSNKTNKINLKQNLSTSELQVVENCLKINSAHITKAGLDDKKEKTNQDSFLILENLFENILNIFGVFDGHGKNGHLISSLVSNFLSQYLTKKENYCNTNNLNDSSDSDSSSSSKEITINNESLSSLFSSDDFIKKIISELDMKANECNFDLQFSGTTCLLLFIFNNTLICSNIGDSICVLFNCSNEDRWTHETLSIIHKPDINSEKERILSNGGVIHPYYDEFGIYEGPNRVYVKGKTYPGLSLTRSIGDLEGEKIGIISEPDIVVKKMDSTCKYVVLGSDGLWDVIKPYDVRRIVNPFFYRNDPNGACQALLKTAKKNWEKDGYERDDITIIVVFIGNPN
jgi:serine/threonine protein phosphatase PrpC